MSFYSGRTELRNFLKLFYFQNFCLDERITVKHTSRYFWIQYIYIYRFYLKDDAILYYDVYRLINFTLIKRSV